MGLARVVCFLSRPDRMPLLRRTFANSRRSTVIRIVGLLCLVALSLIVVRIHRGWRQDYVLVGADDHTSVLHLLSSEISMRRIEVLPPCPDCDSGPATGLTRPLVAVFVLVDAVKRFRHIDEAFGNSFIECSDSYDYTVFVLRGKTSSAEAAGKADDNAWIDRLLASSLEECRTKRRRNVVVWLASVSPERNFAGAVNDILIEAYFDNVTWFDVFVWSDDRPDQPGFRKWETDPATLLADAQNIGVVVDQETVRGCCDAGHVFFHKSHYEIFGNFFPPTIRDLAASIDYLTRIYSSQGLLRPQLRPSRGVGSTVRSKQADAVDKSTVVYFDVESTLHYNDRVNGDKTDEQNQWAKLLALDTHVLSRYMKAFKAANRCLRCALLNRSSSVGRRVISMSLYGDQPRYTLGAVRNAHLLPIIFPGWKLWIYCDRPEPPQPPGESDPQVDATCASVPAQVTHRLRELGAEMKHAPRSAGGVAPMLWRFLPVDDVTVDVFVSRDADSRLSERDAAAVSAWLNSDAMLHCIRDHPSHAGYPLSGGLWGARTRWLRLTLGGGGGGGGGDGDGPMARLAKGYGRSYLEDMNFLGRDLWPAVGEEDVYCHDSVSCDRWPRSHPFPVERRGFEHVGQVFDAYSRPRQGDVDIMMAAPRNPMCEAEPRPTSPVPS